MVARGPRRTAEVGKKIEAQSQAGQSAALDFGTRATLASAAAWSPNPKAPPFFLDLPTKDGVPQPVVLARWAANAPLAMVDQYVANLRHVQSDRARLSAIRMDCVATPRSCTAFSMLRDPEQLRALSGRSRERGRRRMQNHVLPFFAANLVFERK